MDRALSLVIATLGDAVNLDGLLESLATCKSAGTVEVVIVDQSQTDQLDTVLDRYGSRLAIQHVRVSFRGASRARNAGARVARGDWLGFPDDDCRFLPETLAAIRAAICDDTAGVITGQTVDEQGHPNVLRWQQTAMTFTRWTMFGCLTEATLFVRRSLFFEAGEFDEDFGPGARWPAAEGVELMDRLFGVLGKHDARYDPAIRLQHPTKIPPWNRWAARRFYQYAQGDGALVAKRFSLPVVHWSLRTLAAAALHALTFNRWKALAYLLRAVGLLKGFASYRLWGRQLAP